MNYDWIDRNPAAMVLLGHKHQSMTDIYNDDRGLTKGVWRELELVAA